MKFGLFRGAFGIVKRALKKRTGEEFAIKIMDKFLSH